MNLYVCIYTEIYLNSHIYRYVHTCIYTEAYIFISIFLCISFLAAPGHHLLPRFAAFYTYTYKYTQCIHIYIIVGAEADVLLSSDTFHKIIHQLQQRISFARHAVTLIYKNKNKNTSTHVRLCTDPACYIV